jgi:hypothetical protein
VIDGDGEYERLDVDGPQLDVFADRSTPRSREPFRRLSHWTGVSRSAWISNATPGSSRLTSRAMRGRCENAAVPVRPSRTSPLRPAAIRRTPRTASSMPARIRAASACRNSPAAVRATCLVVRLKSVIQFCFHLPDRMRQHRLRHVQLLGGAPEVAGLGHHREIA